MSSCISIVAEPQVQPELQELERYVHDALGATVKTAPWRGAGNLPQVLRERYKFAQAELLGLRALLVIDSNPEEQPPATVREHMDMLQARQQVDLIYVRAQVTAYNRKRLTSATTIFERYRRWPVCRSSQERVRSAPSTFGAPDIGSHS